MVRISDIDLIKELKANARVSFTELARKYGVSEAAIRKRINKLIEKGIIKRFTIEIDMKKIGYDVEALIGIDTLPEKLMSVIDDLKEDDAIESLYASAGDHMILLHIYFKSDDDLRKYVKELENKEGVTKVCPAIILSKIK